MVPTNKCLVIGGFLDAVYRTFGVNGGHQASGDNVRNMPPLRLITVEDFKHIDKLSIESDEQHGRKENIRNNDDRQLKKIGH
jgi:hypothetical protein